MLSKKLQDAINNQIKWELYSEYLYLSMAAYCKTQGLDGFANWFMIQTQEEHFHAMKFFNFVNEKGGAVLLKAIDGPPVKFKSIKEVFEKSLAHEKVVTGKINKLMDLAIKENDHAVKGFLQWFVDEQVEEEASFDKIVSELRLVGGDGRGMLMLDRELGSRVFTPPAAEGQA